MVEKKKRERINEAKKKRHTRTSGNTQIRRKNKDKCEKKHTHALTEIHR